MGRGTAKIRQLLLLAISGMVMDAACQSCRQDPVVRHRQAYFKGLFEDIYFGEEADRLLFGNARLNRELGKRGGEWLSLTADGVPGSLISSAYPSTALDFPIDGERMIERHGASLLRYEVGANRNRKGSSLRLILGVSPRSAQAPGPDSALSGEVECSNAWVFPGLRRLEKEMVLVIVSLSDREEDASVALQLALVSGCSSKSAEGRSKIVKLLNAITEEPVPVPAGRVDPERMSIKFKVRPFQTIVGGL